MKARHSDIGYLFGVGVHILIDAAVQFSESVDQHLPRSSVDTHKTSIGLPPGGIEVRVNKPMRPDNGRMVEEVG